MVAVVLLGPDFALSVCASCIEVGETVLKLVEELVVDDFAIFEAEVSSLML